MSEFNLQQAGKGSPLQGGEETAAKRTPEMQNRTNTWHSTKGIIKIGILAAMGFVLMNTLHFPIPFAPDFMKIDFGDVPALIGGFALGSFAGFLIQLVKNILNLFTTKTVGIGELSNLIVGASFVVSAAWYYSRHKSLRGAVVSLIIGSITMSTIAVFSNAFFIFPAFAKVSGLSLDDMARAVGSANHFVTNYWSLMLLSVLPFNLVKTAIESIVTFLLYKRISPLLHR